MTLLTVINAVQRLSSLAVTSDVVANGEQTQNILFELAKESAESLGREKYWPDLKTEHTFTATTSATLQASGKPSNFDRILPKSVWNRTTNRQILGPLTSEQWQRANGLPITATIEQLYTLRSDGLHIWPAPTAADTVAYDYMINTPVQSSGGTPQTNFQADTDVFQLNERMLIADIRWRWLEEKGLPYAEKLKTAGLWIESEFNATNSGQVVHIATPPFEFPFEDARIPDGTWPLS